MYKVKKYIKTSIIFIFYPTGDVHFEKFNEIRTRIQWGGGG